MVISTILITAIAVYGGVMLERYRWVRAVKNEKFIAVDGNLYKVIKTGENAG
jgi:hypothetical protein